MNAGRTPNVIVRQADETDLPLLLRLLGQLHAEDPPIELQRATGIWLEIGADTNRFVMVACIDESVIGSLEVRVVPNLTRGGRPFVLVENVIVDTDHRGHGVGSALLNTAKKMATAYGAYKIQLYVGLDGPTLFYESNGFQVEGSVMKYRLGGEA